MPHFRRLWASAAAPVLFRTHAAGVVLHVKNMAQTAAHGNGEDNIRNVYNVPGKLKV
jgi:hypothetical protein